MSASLLHSDDQYSTRRDAMPTVELCSAKSRCDLTQQFLRANIHGAARREHLALVSGNWLATHAHGCLGAAAACCRNPECLAPSSHEVVPDCNAQPTSARSSEDASRSAGSRNP